MAAVRHHQKAILDILLFNADVVAAWWLLGGYFLVAVSVAVGVTATLLPVRATAKDARTPFRAA